MLLTDNQVFVGELVGDVPANGSKFSSILNDSVEEAEAEEQSLKLVYFFAVVEVFLIHISVGPEQVVSESLRGLNCHLNAVLQDRNGEVLSGHRCQPEPKVFVHSCV